MNIDLMTWATMIEVPLFAALFRLIGKNRCELDQSLAAYGRLSSEASELLKDALAEFKLHVARNYVSVTYLKDVESRLTNHLLRIEQKLDDAGRKI